MDEELAQLDAAVPSCLDVLVWALSPGELASLLDGLHAQQQRLAAVQLAVVRELDGQGVAKTQGATSTAVWLRNRLRLSIGAARQLVDWADRFEPAVLAGMGRRILTHVAPDLAEEADRKALGREAKRALEQRHLTFSHRDGGQVRLTGRLDAETAAVLHAALDPLCAPHGLGDTRTSGQRRVDALAEVCRLALRTTELPEHGGDRPQIVITTDYDALTGRLWVPARWTPGYDSLPRPCAGWPATRRSSPPCSTEPGKWWTSADYDAWSPGRPAGSSSSATGAARSPAATGHPAGATDTTSNTRQTAETAPPPTRSCSAYTTTAWSTTTTGPSAWHRTGYRSSFHPPGSIRSQLPRRNHYHQRQ